MAEATETFQADYNFGPAIFSMTEDDYRRILAWRHLYEQVVPLHGDTFVFGVGWGRDMLILSNLRKLYEPLMPRRVIGFDTFEGVPGSDLRDSDGPKAHHGYCATPEGWEGELQEKLEHVNRGHPANDGRGFELIKGRVQDTLPEYLEGDQTAISLAFIDYTIEEPTRFTLEAIKDRLVRGAIVAFNQFKTPFWQAEVQAVRELYGIRFGRLLRSPYHKGWGYLVVE